MTENQLLFSNLEKFNSIQLQSFRGDTLMNRVDQKFVIQINELNALLGEITNDYKVLEIDNKRILRYKSVYFDTPERRFYLDHHNGKPNKIKIRTREYIDTQTSYFEVKKKVKGRRT